MNALGRHLLLELKECNREVLNDLKAVKKALVRAAKEARATVISSSFHRFNPYGISGMVIIAESHLSIHTWPEFKYAAVDIFTCGKHLLPELAAAYLVKVFECKNHSIVEMKRGVVISRDENSTKDTLNLDVVKHEGTSELQMVL